MSGCGSSDDLSFGGSNSAGPNFAGGDVGPLAYEYIPLIKSGDALPGGGRVAPKGIMPSLLSNASSPPPFMGAVVITDSRHVYFHALDEAGTRGIYRIDVDERGKRSYAERVIREGDRLPDGTVVSDFSDGDVNNGDDFVVGVVDPEGINSLQYRAGGSSFVPLVKSGGGLANIKLGEDITQSQGISDDGNLVFVCEYLNSDDDAKGEGLFYMPAGRPRDAQLLIANQDLLPGTTCPIQTMSTTEICPGGRYLVQGSAATGADLGSKSPDGRPQTFLLAGNIGQTPELLAADPALQAGRGVAQGSVYMCPRINPATQVVSYIAQVDENQTDLRLEQRSICIGDMRGGRGTLTPRGSRVKSMLPPVFRGRRSVFFQVFTDDGMEILRWNGGTDRQGRPIFDTLLARGDLVNGRPVETILFGCLPEAVNSRGEFVAIVEFNDGETDIFLGMPR